MKSPGRDQAATFRHINDYGLHVPPHYHPAFSHNENVIDVLTAQIILRHKVHAANSISSPIFTLHLRSMLQNRSTCVEECDALLPQALLFSSNDTSQTVRRWLHGVSPQPRFPKLRLMHNRYTNPDFTGRVTPCATAEQNTK